jgi:hypothetical protein
MNAGCRAVLVLMSAVMALSAAVAQQDEGPIQLPKPKPAAATLLVTCDLACSWKLDGKERGSIAAGDSATAEVELGEHILVATTVEGLDKVQQLVEVKAAGQKVVNLELQAVRILRLEAEQEARDKDEIINARLIVMCDLACNWKLDGKERGHIAAGGSANMKAVPGQHLLTATSEDGIDQFKQVCEIHVVGQTTVFIDLKPVRDARLKAMQEAREKAALEDAGKIWTDPDTRLMWTKKDNGSNVNWQKARIYCQNLRLGGYSDWRLPAIDELSEIYDSRINVAGQMGSGSQAIWHVKGNLQLSGWQWSNSQGNASWQAWLFLFANGERYSAPLTGSGLDRVLCVRPAENNANRIVP